MTKRFSIAFLALGLVLAIVPLLFSQMPRHTKRSEPHLKTRWVLPIPVKMDTLDPQNLLGPTEKSLSLILFSRLVKVTDDLQIQPDVLESWTYDLVGHKYNLVVKNNIFFHNGKPLTAEDIVFSFHRWAERSSLDSDLLLPIKGTKEFRAGKAKSISGITKIHDYSLSVELSEWVDTLVRSLALPRFCIYPKDFGGLSRKEFFQHPIGTGPYRLESYSPEELVYSANDSYHLGKPLTKTIDVQYHPEAQAIKMFQAGLLDNLIMYDVAPESNLPQTKDTVSQTMPSATTVTLLINGKQSWMRQKSVRKAISSLTNRQLLIQRCYPQSTVAMTLIPPEILGSRADATNSPEATTPGIQSSLKNSLKTIPPTELFISGENAVSASCLKDALKEFFVGTPIHPTIASLKRMYQLLKQGRLSLWIEPLEFKNEDPLSILQYFNKTSNEFLLGVELSRLQDLLEQAGRAATDFERGQLYQQIDNFLVQQYYVTPLFYLNSVAVYQKTVHGANSLRSRRFTGNWHQIYVEAEASE